MSDNPRNDSRFTGYLQALGVFGATAAGATVAGRLRGKHLPERFDLLDLGIGAVATQKFARLLAKDSVTAPLRAPVSEYVEPAGSGEVNERPRHGHPEHTLGELVTCPFCLTPWVASLYVVGLIHSPRLARTCAAVFGIVSVSDLLQQGYGRLTA
jgi:hypothetical protein